MLVVVGAVTSLFFVGRSDWGRRRIFAGGAAAGAKALLGELRIGGLDGDLTHMLGCAMCRCAIRKDSSWRVSPGRPAL